VILIVLPNLPDPEALQVEVGWTLGIEGAQVLLVLRVVTHDGGNVRLDRGPDDRPLRLQTSDRGWWAPGAKLTHGSSSGCSPVEVPERGHLTARWPHNGSDHSICPTRSRAARSSAS